MNYIIQQLGLLSFGSDSIDEFTWMLVDPFHARRDHRVVKNVNKTYERVCVVGEFPIPIALAFDSKITIIDDAIRLRHYGDQLKKLYNFNLVYKNPLFNDIQHEIDNSDLIVYHDSEFLVPLNLMNYTHKDKDVLIMNTYDCTYKHCVNYAYSKEDLLFLYPMKEVHGTGVVPFVNDLDTYWAYGRLDD